jgi:hypothetical protein
VKRVGNKGKAVGEKAADKLNNKDHRIKNNSYDEMLAGCWCMGMFFGHIDEVVFLSISTVIRSVSSVPSFCSPCHAKVQTTESRGRDDL